MKKTYRKSYRILFIVLLSSNVLAELSPECIRYEIHESTASKPSQATILANNCYDVNGFLEGFTSRAFDQAGPVVLNTTFECCVNKTCHNDLDCPFNFLCDSVSSQRCKVASCDLLDDVDLVLNEGRDCIIDEDCSFEVPWDEENWKCIKVPCPSDNCTSPDKCKRCSSAQMRRTVSTSNNSTTTISSITTTEHISNLNHTLSVTNKPFTTTLRDNINATASSLHPATEVTTIESATNITTTLIPSTPLGRIIPTTAEPSASENVETTLLVNGTSSTHTESYATLPSTRGVTSGTTTEFGELSTTVSLMNNNPEATSPTALSGLTDNLPETTVAFVATPAESVSSTTETSPHFATLIVPLIRATEAPSDSN